MKKRTKCECTDPQCPHCHGHCQKRSSGKLYRVDMEDESGTAFCGECGEDAMYSGVFSPCRD